MFVDRQALRFTKRHEIVGAFYIFNVISILMKIMEATDSLKKKSITLYLICASNQVDQEDVNGAGSPNDDEDLSSSADTPRGSWASLDLRHSQHDPLLPGLLDRVCPETIDLNNEQKRSEDRQVNINLDNTSWKLKTLPVSLNND